MPMYSACGNAALPALGFPIRESADHRLFSAYPRLIAAVHALHRLQVPRHPPCALLILTVITYSGAQATEARGDTRFIGKTVRFSRTVQEWRRRDSPSVSQNSTACGARSSRAPRLRPGPVDIARTCRLIQPRYAAAKTGQALQSWRLP